MREEERCRRRNRVRKIESRILSVTLARQVFSVIHRSI